MQKKKIDWIRIRIHWLRIRIQWVRIRIRIRIRGLTSFIYCLFDLYSIKLFPLDKKGTL